MDVQWKYAGSTTSPKMLSSHRNMLSFDTMREFLLENDGKVKQSDMKNTFRELTHRDESIKKRARQEYKDIQKRLSTRVKIEGKTKFIYLPPEQLADLQEVGEDEGEEEDEEEEGEEKEHVSTSEHGEKSGESSNQRRDENDDENVETQANQTTPGGVPKFTAEHESALMDAIKKRSNDINSAIEKRNNDTNGSRESLSSTDSDLSFSDEDEVQVEEVQWMNACCQGNVELLEELHMIHPYLMEHKDFLNGYTLLHWAAKKDNIDMINFILKHHDVGNLALDIKSHAGLTPLHIAALAGKVEVMTKLLDLGASIHVRDNAGKKPKDIVKDTVDPYMQNKLGKRVVPQKTIETNLTVSYRKHRKSRASLRPGHLLEETASPMSSPELSRRRAKSTGVRGSPRISRRKFAGSSEKLNLKGH